jgi:phenylpropionate dioxygenase-like ring-hydroxylating dioxygenase large terminal subunit
MDRNAEAALIDRALQMADASQMADSRQPADLAGPETGVAQWPVESYLDPRRFEREMAVVRRQPIPLAHVSQLPEPGDFRVENVFGRSVLLVHGEAGRHRALLNVCRHRGAEVVRAECGTATSFVCPYHAWSYDTDGRLTSVPDGSRSFPGLRLADRGLVELPSEVRHGLLWVTLDGGGVPVEQFLGPELDADLATCGLAGYATYQEGALDRRFNWKTGAESFMESYHFAVLHRRTAGRVFLHNVGAYDQLGRHFRTLAPKKTLRDLRDVDRASRRIRGHATVMYLIFPSTVLFVEKDHVNLLVILPEDVERCRVLRTHLVQRLSPRLREYWDANIDLFMGAVGEDLDICESMQRGYRSGANTTVTFGRNEQGCDAYRRVVEAALTGETRLPGENGSDHSH